MSDPGREPAEDDAREAATGVGNAPLQAEAAESAERSSVQLREPDEIAYWSDRFTVTPAQLEEAVSAVGTDPHAVATYLRGQGAD